MNVTMNLDTSNGIANVYVHDPASGHGVVANQIKLGNTAHMTVAQADAHARALAKQALHAAAAAL